MCKDEAQQVGNAQFRRHFHKLIQCHLTISFALMLICNVHTHFGGVAVSRTAIEITETDPADNFIILVA
ncbi:hypothetical protein D3C72_2488700 [compost metagenome]